MYRREQEYVKNIINKLEINLSEFTSKYSYKELREIEEYFILLNKIHKYKKCLIIN